MFFQGQPSNSVLSPFLAHPTALLNELYITPLIPRSTLPFNLLVTLNSIRLNLEYARAHRGVDRGYLQVFEYT